MKLIIELSNGTVYGVKKKDRFTWTTLDELKEAIKKGKPLQTELEEIKEEIGNHYIKADNGGLYTAIKILDEHIKELNNDL